MSHPDVVFRGKDYVVTRLTVEEDMALMEPLQILTRALEDYILLANLTRPDLQRDADEARRQSDLYGV